jgi:hypothetical protein
MHIHLKTFHLQINTIEVEIVEKGITLFKVHTILNYSSLATGSNKYGLQCVLKDLKKNHPRLLSSIEKDRKKNIQCGFSG